MSTTSVPSPPPLEDIQAALRARRESPNSLELDLQLVTPMFGGGVEPATVDTEQPFRPSAIRGQLRFWWRATAGARCATPDELFRAESAIWGETDKKSKVAVRVANVIPGPLVAGWSNAKPEQPQSVYFSITREELRGEIPKNGKRLMASGSFRLELQWDHLDSELAEQVKQAVTAWVLFGGVGARTRRGCGTLYASAPPGFDPNRPAESIRTLIAALPKDTRRWPTLGGASLFLGPVPQPHRQAWEALIKSYAEFRQRRPPVDPETGRPGRSNWPEPEAIRESTGKRCLPRHSKFIPADPTVFPRALLGLPIIAQFKDENQGDPRNTTLQARSPQGVELRRHASPLILKILPLGSSQALPMALVLKTDVAERLGGRLELREGNRSVAKGLSAGFSSPLDIKPTARAGEKQRTLRQFLQTTVGEEIPL